MACFALCGSGVLQLNLLLKSGLSYFGKNGENSYKLIG
jgi:hypothetical protein